ncbi:MAG TPA: hypothetical protein VFA65_24490 [Bryobacteraceae bacterium]|nr:hypothetical protein [Bryobacteraceae bacterium]
MTAWIIAGALSEMEQKWRDWLKDNPDADSHGRYYAAGVIDGIAFARGTEHPNWKVTLPETANAK